MGFWYDCNRNNHWNTHTLANRRNWMYAYKVLDFQHNTCFSLFRLNIWCISVFYCNSFNSLFRAPPKIDIYKLRLAHRLCLLWFAFFYFFFRKASKLAYHLFVFIWRERDEEGQEAEKKILKIFVRRSWFKSNLVWIISIWTSIQSLAEE